jgi:hypothetical protein
MAENHHAHAHGLRPVGPALWQGEKCEKNHAARGTTTEPPAPAGGYGSAPLRLVGPAPAVIDPQLRFAWWSPQAIRRSRTLPPGGVRQHESQSLLSFVSQISDERYNAKYNLQDQIRDNKAENALQYSNEPCPKPASASVINPTSSQYSRHDSHSHKANKDGVCP